MVEKLYLYESTNPAKKYMLKFINPETDRIKTVHFGASAYDDYTSFPKAERDERKARYLNRHKKEDWTDPHRASTLSRYILWNLPTIGASIRDMNKIFGIKIIKKF